MTVLVENTIVGLPSMLPGDWRQELGETGWWGGGRLRRWGGGGG